MLDGITNENVTDIKREVLEQTTLLDTARGNYQIAMVLNRSRDKSSEFLDDVLFLLSGNLSALPN